MNSQKNDQIVRLREVCQDFDDTHSDLDVRESTGYSDIHLSVLGISHKSLERAIKEHPNDINSRDKLGRTALFWASSRGDEDALRCLLKHGADPNIPEIREGQTPLHAAAAGGLIDRVQTLLGAPDGWIKEFDIHPGPPLSFARVDAESRTGVMDLLLKYGADINARNSIHNNAPVHQAIILGIFENVKFLVEHGADIEAQNVNGGSPIDVCIWEHQIRILKYLLSQGAGFRYRTVFGENILHTLARTRHVDIMRFLSHVNMEGADPDGRNHFGQTPDQLFQSFRSVISPIYGPPSESQRDAWIELIGSVSTFSSRLEELDSDVSENSSTTEEYTDAAESFG